MMAIFFADDASLDGVIRRFLEVVGDQLLGTVGDTKSKSAVAGRTGVDGDAIVDDAKNGMLNLDGEQSEKRGGWFIDEGIKVGEESEKCWRCKKR